MDFTQFVYTLEGYGLTDALLPFLLIFAVIFAILQKVKIFGKEKKNINVILAVVIGLLVVIPHVTNSYPPGGDIVEIMNNAIPNVSLIIISIIMLLILVGVFGSEIDIVGTSLAGWVAFISLLIVGYIFGRAAGWFEYLPNWLSWLDDPETQALVIILLVFGLLIWFVTKEPKKTTEGRISNGFKEIGKIFK
ncbi:hypothetical protein H8D83_02325 [Candidatus Woesearchaeota archaeon]|nr:hypothetical protein [Candidatus Woesearchaeota archaeon]MBL7051229.1 hypothetical protein [Candidatus Woesearchaeota archaeon]